MNGRTIAVTGASGFIGGVVSLALAKLGYRVVALGRRPVPPYEHREYDLSTDLVPGLLAEVDAVVHCAYDLSLTDPRAIEVTNVGGTRTLVDAATNARVRLILVSSMSAYPGTTQIYGQAKLHSETDVLAAGGEAVRVGLVWGGAEGGMIGTLKRAARLPVVPIFKRNLHQFTLHADDMAAGFVKLIESPRFGQPLGLAHPAPVRFERILREMGDGRRQIMFPVPWRPTYAAMRAAERAGLRLPVRADSLLGLVRPAPYVANVEFWSQNGLRLRAFAQSASA